MQTGDELLDNAASLAETGSFEEAAVLYQQFLRGTPRHFEALKALGMIYFQMGQMDKAQYLLGEALKIDPFSTDGSYLFQKLLGTGAGDRMPYNSDPLPADQIDLIRNWILEGAANN